MLRRLMRSPRLFPALFFLFVLLMASRNSKFTTDAAAPATEAKQGLTGSYCTTTGLWYSGTPPDPAEPVNRFVQVWIDRNDFRLPNPFTDPLVARADAQVAFGHGKGFVPQIGQQAAANAKYDLTGTWSADYVDGPLKVQITQTGTQVNAVLITGNQYIPAGKRDFYGTFDSNPFQGKQIWAYAGYRSPHWEDAEITVVDADHFTLVSKGDTVHFARDCNPDKNRLCGALSNASEIDRKMTDWGAKERHTPTGKEWNEILSARGPELASGLEEALNTQPEPEKRLRPST